MIIYDHTNIPVSLQDYQKKVRYNLSEGSRDKILLTVRLT